MIGRNVYTTSVCVSSRWPGGLRAVRLPAGSCDSGTAYCTYFQKNHNSAWLYPQRIIYKRLHKCRACLGTGHPFPLIPPSPIHLFFFGGREGVEVRGIPNICGAEVRLTSPGGRSQPGHRNFPRSSLRLVISEKTKETP